MLTAQNSTGVRMNQCAATHGSDAKPWLWTGGAADCIVVAAYADVKRAYIVHIDRTTELSDWTSTFGQAMSGYKPSVYIVSNAVRDNPHNKTLLSVRKYFSDHADKVHAVTETAGDKFAISAIDGRTNDTFDGHSLIGSLAPTSAHFAQAYWSLADVKKPAKPTTGPKGSKESPL